MHEYLPYLCGVEVDFKDAAGSNAIKDTEQQVFEVDFKDARCSKVAKRVRGLSRQFRVRLGSPKAKKRGDHTKLYPKKKKKNKNQIDLTID